MFLFYDCLRERVASSSSVQSVPTILTLTAARLASGPEEIFMFHEPCNVLVE